MVISDYTATLKYTWQTYPNSYQYLSDSIIINIKRKQVTGGRNSSMLSSGRQSNNAQSLELLGKLKHNFEISINYLIKSET